MRDFPGRDYLKVTSSYIALHTSQGHVSNVGLGYRTKSDEDGIGQDIAVEGIHVPSCRCLFCWCADASDLTNTEWCEEKQLEMIWNYGRSENPHICASYQLNPSKQSSMLPCLVNIKVLPQVTQLLGTQRAIASAASSKPASHGSRCHGQETNGNGELPAVACGYFLKPQRNWGIK